MPSGKQAKGQRRMRNFELAGESRAPRVFQQKSLGNKQLAVSSRILWVLGTVLETNASPAFWNCFRSDLALNP
jgi:hypothetical protein